MHLGIKFFGVICSRIFTTWFSENRMAQERCTSVAEKWGNTIAQVALRWGLQMSHSVLPKSKNETRIKENLDVFNWSIPKDLLAELSKIEQATRIFILIWSSQFTICKYISSYHSNVVFLYARLVRGNFMVNNTYGD